MTERRGIRPEIQALRAAAVLAVVLYHLWPVVLTGGFVGVDVFFVVSGFLITAHLVRERERTGRIGLGSFWARRARRLLPAALLVLFITCIAVVVWMPQIFWAQFFRESIASALYVENWVLAGDAVDYLAAHQAASAAQHYWSLSVEEQFYLVWPLLLVAAYALSARLAPARRRTVIAIVLGVVVTASLACSIIWTAADPAGAYFVTPTRAWEFGLGGLLALAPLWVTNDRVRSVVSWLGWIAIALAVIRFTASTPFPGYTALLPVLGTVAVIAAGSPTPVWGPRFLVSLPPVQWLGGISYSLYLWHWPLIVIAPYVLGYPQLALLEKAVILAIAITAAWLTKRFVEDPVRDGRLAHARPRFTLVASLAAMLVVVVPSIAAVQFSAQRIAQDDALRAELATMSCFGAPSIADPESCADADFPVISPDEALAPEDVPALFFADPPCLASATEAATCRFGVDGGLRVALIGDSHAAQWQPALEVLAHQEGWQLDTYLKTNCAFTTTNRSAAYEGCTQWSLEVAGALDAQQPYDLVITSFFAENLGLEVDSGLVTSRDAISGFRDAWQPLLDDGSRIAVIPDTPHMADDVTICVALHPKDAAQCSAPRQQALAREDLQVSAARGIQGVTIVDMSDLFCSASQCPAVIGGVAVHTDPFHITATYSRTLAPFLGTALAPLATGAE